MSQSYELRNHLEWLGYVQPVGLVVSAPAMLAAECQINRNMGPNHQRFLAALPLDENEDPTPIIPDFATFAQNVLDWREADIVPFPENPSGDMESLQVVLPAYNETLQPTHVVPEFKPGEEQNPWAMLIQELDPDVDLDEEDSSDSRGWHASPHMKFERLLRESDVSCGLITNGKHIRLVYAPKGETSGYITFEVDQMITVAGRPIFAAFHMLLCEERMFSMEPGKRLPAILVNSRKYQNTVSTQLAQQVMAALFELLRGFQAANDQRGGELLKRILENDPQHVYHGLLTVLMRMVFVLYAEDRGLISTDPIYANHYSITGLFDRLRSDDGRYPDTMDQRYGAWAQLLTLFRLIYSGGQHADLKIPARDGYLFDPNRYPFLEGRFDDNDVNIYSDPERRSPINVPRVSDGVVFRVLHSLLVLDGERLSYRTLDVEQIGSVYEAIMGFELEVAEGRSIAIKPVKKHGAPATINLEALLEAKPASRAKLLQECSDQKLTGSALKDLKDADSIEGLLSALDKKIAKDVTPNIVPTGAMIFQPSDERRRSGSHYTPRSLTEPIVRTTLEPILKQLCDSETALPTVWEPTAADNKRYTKGEIAVRIRLSENHVQYAEQAREKGVPHPAQILDLKICDPAMGSGAFLVETCRQLGDELIKAWYAHDMVPPDIPADEDEVLYARRLVAQRCLYGVDKNVMAVDLAKLSLWLVTLARDHAFTFLDHSLRHGDSLVGLSRQQIIGFHWDSKKFKTLLNDPIQKRLDRATEARAKILNAREDVPYKDQEQRLAVADEALDLIRLLGDSCVSCFFAGSKKKTREEEADRVYGLASAYLESQQKQQVDQVSCQSLVQAAERLNHDEYPVPAFHWEIEFPEVFSRENGGFDAFIGNPPFAGKNTISASNHSSFADWLKASFADAHGNSDLVAYFFRAGFEKTRSHGTDGLIATNSIGQGDTRQTGLRWICENGGRIYSARRRIKWPGQAAVVVSVVHIQKSSSCKTFVLDGNEVPTITAFLFHRGGNDHPNTLQANANTCFVGYGIYGPGFTFDDGNESASPLHEMETLIEKNPKNQERIFPYLGGDSFLSDVEMSHSRYVISFGLMSLEEASKWPDLLDIVRQKVKPYRDSLPPTNGSNRKRREFWWQFGAFPKKLDSLIGGFKRVMMHPFTSTHLAFGFIPSSTLVAAPHNVFLLESDASFSCLQSRVHEIWVRFFGSSLEDRMRYTASDCFLTFPFPENYLANQDLSRIGDQYQKVRRDLMNDHHEGLTSIYNRFHSPNEVGKGFSELRKIHSTMDKAVLRAYGWDDLVQSLTCGFGLDYLDIEDDEMEAPENLWWPSGSEALSFESSLASSRKRLPWRYRWPDDFREEVLARLLELNEQRHKKERLVGNEIDTEPASKPPKTKYTSKQKQKETPLFD